MGCPRLSAGATPTFLCRRRARGISPALHRGLDPSVPPHHTLHHSPPQASQPSQPHPFPSHARSLRFLLRLPPLPHLHWSRPGLRLCCHDERRGQAPLHHRRLHRVRSAHSAGRYFYKRLDSPSRRKKLASSPPPHLRGRPLRRYPLLLARQVRSPPPPPLRRPPRPPPSL